MVLLSVYLCRLDKQVWPQSMASAEGLSDGDCHQEILAPESFKRLHHHPGFEPHVSQECWCLSLRQRETITEKLLLAAESIYLYKFN